MKDCRPMQAQTAQGYDFKHIFVFGLAKLGSGAHKNLLKIQSCPPSEVTRLGHGIKRRAGFATDLVA